MEWTIFNEMKYIELYLSLGSNLGDRYGYINKAIEYLDSSLEIHHHLISDIIETKPWGNTSGENFLNCVVCYKLPLVGQDADLFCLSLLRIIKEIEFKLGRSIADPMYNEKGDRVYSERTIDIDILFYGQKSIDLGSLIIPHKDISRRDFVLIPLKQIASMELRQSFPRLFLI